ncbi:resolvase [Cupriavidus metallidurans]|nr:resolvase [Cupriavidus metallidurans]
MVHTSIEHRRVLCRGILISGYQEPYAQQASNRAEWCSRLLKMTAGWSDAKLGYSSD